MIPVRCEGKPLARQNDGASLEQKSISLPNPMELIGTPSDNAANHRRHHEHRPQREPKPRRSESELMSLASTRDSSKDIVRGTPQRREGNVLF